MNIPIPSFLATLRAGLALLLLAFALSATSGRAQYAAPPQLMSYQGFLTDANGNPLGATNTGPKNYNVVFRVWDLQTGGTTNGSDELYAEQQTVTVNNGYFSVLLGQGTQYNTEPHTNSLASLFYSTNANPRYVEITVLGIGVSGANITILPRLQLLTSPYAFLAANAVNATTATTLVNNNNTTQVVTVTNGTVGIGDTSPIAELSLGSSLANDKLALFDNGNPTNIFGLGIQTGQFRLNLGGAGSRFSFLATPSSTSELMTILGTGNVGIGTSSPVAALDVENSSYPSALIRSSSPVGTWFDLANTSSGGGYWSVISTGSGNGEGAGKLLFSAAANPSLNNADVLTLQNNGNVGIGTTAPGTTLEVGGSATIDGELYMKNGQTMAANNSSGNAENFFWPRWSDNVTYLNFGSGGFNIRNDTSTQVMFMQPDGNVDIGNTTDEASLTVSPSSVNGVNFELLKPGSTIGYQFEVETGGLDICEHNIACARFYIQNGTGFIGLGTATPKYPLDVENTTSTSVNNYGYLGISGVAGKVPGNSGTYPFSIYGAGRIVSGQEFDCVSDARIKEVVDRSDTRADLATVRKLQITDYRKVDKVQYGGRLEKGVIAQEVEKIVPEAVSSSTNFIPNIYALPKAIACTNQILMITLARPHGLVVGDLVRLITEDGIKEIPVAAVPSPLVFAVGGVSQAPKQVFVYGKEVGDFRSVNYDRLFTTGLGAIQELAKRVDDLDAREGRLAALERKAAQVDDLEAQVADLKKLVAQLAEATKNSKLTADKLVKSVTTASLDR